jgi:hypothetical protein
MFTRTLVAAAASLLMFTTTGPTAYAQAVEARGAAEVSIKGHKDAIAARAAARKAAERDAIRSALKLRLNVDLGAVKNEEAITELTKNLVDQLQTTFRTEGDVLTATTRLTVEAAQLTDMARSLGLQNSAVMEASSILFMIDEYWGIATNLDPSKPVVSETEYHHNKSSFSDTSARAAGSAFSDTSAKSSSASSSSASFAGSARESASGSYNHRASASGSSESSFAGSDRRAIAVQDGHGAAGAASRSTQVAASQRDSFSGSVASSGSASRNSDVRVAAASSESSARASDQKNVHARAFSGEQKNIQQQNDIVTVRTRTVFPDVANAKPSDAQSALVAPRLAQVVSQYGLRYTSERDLRETGKGRMLIADIEQQRRFDEYTRRAGTNPFNAKYVVYGTAVMNAEGRSASGATLCAGSLKLESFNVDTGRGLVTGTLNKRAQGSSDQDCRANLSTALATELAETVGSAATRELQLIATQGQAYTVTLFSESSISRRVGGPFEDGLRSLASGDVREDKRTDSTRVYTVASKGSDFSRRLERLLDDLGEGMRNAELKVAGNRVVVCIEGRCPKEF